MNIQEVVDRYFAGCSSVEDERFLKSYFANEKQVADEFKYLKPLFDYINDEAEALKIYDEVKAIGVADDKVGSTKIRKTVFAISSIAASLVIGMFILFGNLKNNGDKSYVWIDGKKTTKPETVTKYFENSIDNVALDINIIEEQLSAMFED